MGESCTIDEDENEPSFEPVLDARTLNLLSMGVKFYGDWQYIGSDLSLEANEGAAEWDWKPPQECLDYWEEMRKRRTVIRKEELTHETLLRIQQRKDAK